MTPRAAPHPRTEVPTKTLGQRVLGARSTPVAMVWTATALMSMLGPDLVSDGGARHVPLTALTAWVWAGVATGLLRLAPGPHLAKETMAIIAGTWGAALFLSVTAPVVVVGNGTTQIPVTGCLAPALAAVITGYAVLVSLAHGPSRVPAPRR